MNAFLQIVMYLLVPWTAVNLVDYYWVRHGEYAITAIYDDDGIYGRWGTRGLVAYGLGLVAMAPFISLGFYTGPLAAGRNRRPDVERAAVEDSRTRLAPWNPPREEGLTRMDQVPVVEPDPSVPTFASPTTFARVSRLDEVRRAEITIVGAPFAAVQVADAGDMAIGGAEMIPLARAAATG